VWGEQGVGDEVGFASMLPDLIKRGARVVLECAPRLAPLFQRSFKGAEVVAKTALKYREAYERITGERWDHYRHKMGVTGDAEASEADLERLRGVLA